jgi:hypothetical protein
MKIRTVFHRVLPAALLALGGAAMAVSPASAESIRGVFTREDGMNAVRYRGESWTIHELIERRELAPGRFDLHHQRLGHGLRMGIDGLQERRALNPRRFDYYHPFLGHLVADPLPDAPPSGIGGLGEPDQDPELIIGGGPSTSPPTNPLNPPMFAEEPPPISPPALPQEPSPPGVVPPPGGNPGGPPPPISSAVVPEPPGLLQAALGLAGLAGVLAWRRLRGLQPSRLARS